MNYITFDIETYSPSKLNKIDVNELRVSVTGAYISWIDEYIAFMEDETKDFINLMKQAELIIGYNHLWFDLPVLQKYSDYDLKKLPSYDIMIEVEKKIGFKLKLDNLCKTNLGTNKTDSYEQYKHYHWEKKFAPLIDYCMNDVLLTEKIFRQIVETQKLKYTDLLDTKALYLEKPKAGEVIKIEETTESIF
jgi:DEAD/DEAH box helicase domain-containing protein